MPRKSLDEKGAKAKARSKPPNAVADLMMAEMAGDGPDARAWPFADLVQGPSGGVYGYNGRYWEPVTPDTLRALAFQADLRFNGGATSQKRRSEIVDYLKASNHDRDLEFARVADHEIPAHNGVIDVRTGMMRPHRAEDMLDSVLPVDYDASEPCPDWNQVLIDWFGDTNDEDGGRARALQDFCGYVALPHARFKKALFLQGPKDCGKSLVIHVLRAFVGRQFWCTLGVEDMDDTVARAVIKHKKLNVITELSAEAMIKDGGFKTMVSTEEPIMINAKYESPISYIPLAKHVIAANTLPRINDRTSATVERLLIVPFTTQIAADKMDRSLEKTLISPRALTGFLNWCVEGAARLIERGGLFLPVPRAEELIAAMRAEANSFVAFRDELLCPDDTAEMKLAELTDEFNAWKKGSKKIDVREMGRLVRGAGIDVTTIQNDNGGRAKGIKGWRLRQAADGGTPPPDVVF